MLALHPYAFEVVSQHISLVQFIEQFIDLPLVVFVVFELAVVHRLKVLQLLVLRRDGENSRTSPDDFLLQLAVLGNEEIDLALEF